MAVLLLLVDDDTAYRALAVDVLRDLGIEEVVEAGTAAVAMDKACRLRPDAALVDVGLPDRDGIELAHEIAALPWRPAVVLISADRDVAARLDSGSDAAPPFVPKDELPTAPLRRLLELD
jgi:CheY-like chemotaxis protein